MTFFRIVFLSFVGLATLSPTLIAVSVHAQEPQSPIIIVDAKANASIAEQLVQKVVDSWPWYLTRTSGLVAGFVLVLLMLSGIGFITGTSYAFLEPLTGWATHRALGIVLTVSLALHVFALYFDHFVPFGFADLFVPFISDYKPIELFGVSFGSLYVALGIVALYLILLVVIVSIVWVDRKTRAWKLVHLMSYFAMAFVFVHALYLGTDLSSGVLRYIWIALGVLVLTAALVRLWRAKTV